MRLLVVVPAYNEAKVITNTLKRLKKVLTGLDPVVVVIDDGSSDQTKANAQVAGVRVLRHAINRGLGGALGTGLAYAKANDYELMVTLDADGQHDPKDVFAMIEPLIRGDSQVTIGTRTRSREGKLPKDRALIIWLSNFLTRLMFGQPTSDSQSGFRGFGKEAIQNIQLKTERMEVSSELFYEIKRLNLSVAEVPIKVIYTNYSRSKGQTNLNSLNIVYKLFLRLFR